MEPSLRLPVLGVPQILLVLADDLTFDALRDSKQPEFISQLENTHKLRRCLCLYLPSRGALVLLSQLLFQVRETLGNFVDGLVQVAVLVVLRVEILLVAAALLARDDRSVLQSVRLGIRFRWRRRG